MNSSLQYGSVFSSINLGDFILFLALPMIIILTISKSRYTLGASVLCEEGNSLIPTAKGEVVHMSILFQSISGLLPVPPPTAFMLFVSGNIERVSLNIRK